MLRQLSRPCTSVPRAVSASRLASTSTAAALAPEADAKPKRRARRTPEEMEVERQRRADSRAAREAARAMKARTSYSGSTAIWGSTLANLSEEVQHKVVTLRFKEVADGKASMEQYLEELMKIQRPPIPEEVPLPESMARFPLLPPLRFWDDLFWRASTVAQRERIAVHNPETALAMAHAFLDSDATRSTGPKTVIEAFPGPGMLSRALLTLPEDKLGRLIILEDDARFLPFLEPLAKADPRVTVLPMSGFDWATYTHMDDKVLTDIPKLPFDAGLHPNLHFISHIFMTAQHEQFVSQLHRCIPQKSWLFQYGRVPMSLIMGEWGFKRLTAGENDMERCKHSVISQISAQTDLAIPMEATAPFTSHFHPVKVQHLAIERRAVSRRIGSPYLAVNVVPHTEQLILPNELEAWDFVIRKLFVQKRTPIRQSIGSIAPGAEYLLKYANQNASEDKQIDAAKSPPEITNDEWARLIREFINWPFAPEDLSVDAFMRYDEKD
ncbi:unnamed protein product [Peniophora sp. CBMAI 1063]|nr:unnamed protein product [Peniophora sp. CBMAI 1063]